MGSGKNNKDMNCVCDTLLAIVEAQDQVKSTCPNSCDAAIQELVGGTTSPNNTIPVMLTNAGNSDLFIGSGVRRNKANPNTGLEVINAIVFKVKDVDPETCCATLELLQEGENRDVQELLDMIEDTELDSTDVCITVDLDCFCSVTCLPPISL
ncbi:MAG: CotY/CotZ family spore coat protein [Caldibacillus sp.]